MTRVVARGIELRYPRAARAALQGVDLEVGPGGLTALLGPNGSGKSTLLAVLLGLLSPERGEVDLGGDDPTRLSRARVALRAAYLPARPHVPADVTAREVVLLGRHPFGRGLLLEREEDVRRADEALALTGARELADRLCVELSSGERQRVLLARTLCQGVDLLLLDEPTSAQDPAHALDLFALFSRLASSGGKTVVVATHDVNAAARHADRLVVLAEGRRVSAGPPAEVLTAELLADVFQVDALLGQDGETPYVVPRGRR